MGGRAPDPLAILAIFNRRARTTVKAKKRRDNAEGSIVAMRGRWLAEQGFQVKDSGTRALKCRPIVGQL